MKTLQRVKGLVHDLTVTRDGRLLTLWSQSGVRHTVLDLGAPHLPGLEYARDTLLGLAYAPAAQRALVLGLGGASIPRMLRAARPYLVLDTVEIDPAVIELANRYFHLSESPDFRVYVEDAAGYVARCDAQYDIIILDAYIGETIAPQCTTEEFLGQVRRRLSSQGIFAVNCVDIHAPPFRSMLLNACSRIGEVSVLHGRRSRNAVAFAPVQPVELQVLVEEAERLEYELDFKAGLPQMARQLRRLRP